MDTDASVYYQAVLARDSRYDGQFFTCVRTTGIYCRPICPARPPLLKHCTFVRSAAAAQDGGYRPCLRCRPESAPGMGAWCGTSSSVQRALSLIDGGALDEGDVQALAARLGMGDRHLRRLFKLHLGTTPIAVAQTRRVMLAQQLIHHTSLSMTDVAMASGFGSVRRFNETFSHLFGRAPGALRRQRQSMAHTDTDVVLHLAYRPPYDWPRMLAFLRARVIPGVERVDDTTYRRVIEPEPATDVESGLLLVRHSAKGHALEVRLKLPNLARLPAIVARVRRMFDLDADPIAIEASLARDPFLAAILARQTGLRLPGAWDAFEAAVRAVLGQQITVAGATKLAGQLAARLGKPAPSWPDHPGLTHAFPPPQAFTASALATLPMPAARKAALLGLAQSVANQPSLLLPGRSLEEGVAQLCALPGIGDWTAHYIAMRALHESDAFPAADVGLQRAMAENGVRPSAKALLRRAQAWRPWRAYAVLHLWTTEMRDETTQT